MKNLLFFAILVSLVSCKSGADAHKAAITDLSTNWEAATKAVTDFSQMVSTEQSGLASSIAEMTLAPEVLSKLKPDVQTQIGDALNAITSSGTGYAKITDEVTAFATDWATKGEGVKMLTDGLAAGKIDGDVAAKIAELTGYVTDANSKVEGWKGAFEAAKTGVSEKVSAYKAIVEGVMPAKK